MKEGRPALPGFSSKGAPLTPGDVYECDIEILPTYIVLPVGWRVALTVRGRDYEYEGELSEFGKKFHYGTRGDGWHDPWRPR